MDCMKTISLYLKEYITDEQFINIFFEYINDFQQCLEKDIYLNILFTNFNSKEGKISLRTKLHDYVINNNLSLYEYINDSSVEHMIDSGENDVVTEILRKKYEQKEEIRIDCSVINSQTEFITAIKRALQYPQFCGDNWDAIEDLVYDIIFPKKLVFSNWLDIEKKMPGDTAILKKILSKYNVPCIIIYD